MTYQAFTHIDICVVIRGIQNWLDLSFKYIYLLARYNINQDVGRQSIK